ncbi:DUF3833 domain-containing protein [Desulforhopalus sp. IMCC35007]|uniref:DUF3833 domain-containing protein n=1 Tax=Desulforhopalus sp. IMCC35007 TaxID=2569543 RepID=UPI0010AE916E|nr:DUF3833 domain-containing protein [Desulforhopalus sp. IMCC35007]TKB07269.1 DUF3833 domain-containing protein [Desulforhopalus sp. IMCC35007]
MKSIIISILLLLLSGCSAIDMSRYSHNTPKLDLFDYFNGNTRGWGIVQDRKGTLTRQFVVDIVGQVNSKGNLVLDEHFDWSDGEKSQRIWELSKQSEHDYSGTAADVIESADGKLYGNVLNWKYLLNLKVDDTTWKIRFDDWMFLVSDELLLNKATMTKFGFKVGEVTIVFQKVQP